MLNKVWMMVKKMIGKFKPPRVAVLIKDGTHAISDLEKANMLARAFADIHKGSRLEERYMRRKEEVLKINRNILNTKESNMSIMDTEINMSELKRALSNTAYSASGTCVTLCLENYLIIYWRKFLSCLTKCEMKESYQASGN